MRIGEAKQRDVGKKRARVGPEAMDFLRAEPGDVIEIMGSRTSCAIIWPVDEDEKFPDQNGFQQLKSTGLLTSPEEAASRILNYIARADFGSNPVSDVRDA